MRPRLKPRLPRHDRPYSHSRSRPPVLETVRASLAADEAAGALRVDLERQTVSAAGKELPLSPVMDSRLMERALERRGMKPRPKPGPKVEEDEPFGQFRRELPNNLYAQMLAQPVRYCQLTRLRLPRTFLMDFRPAAHPSGEGKAWWVPEDLLAEANVKKPADENGKHGIDEVGKKPGAYQAGGNLDSGKKLDTREAEANKASENPITSEAGENIDTKEAGEDTNKPVENPETAAARREARKQTDPGKVLQHRAKGRTSRALLRADVLSQHPDNPGKRESMSVQMLAPNMWRAAKLPEGRPPVWRERMSEVVLDVLRRGAVRGLLALARKEARVVPVVAGEKYRRGGYVLWTGEGQEMGDEGPGLYAVTTLEGATGPEEVPVYNLRMLVGEEHLGRLRAEAEVLRGNSMVHVSRGNEAQEGLWRLQGMFAWLES